MGKMKEHYIELWGAWPETLVDGIITFHKIKYDNAYDVCLGEDTVIGAIHVEVLGLLQFRYSFEPMPNYSVVCKLPKTQKAITKRFFRQLAAYVFIGE